MIPVSASWVLVREDVALDQQAYDCVKSNIEKAITDAGLDIAMFQDFNTEILINIEPFLNQAPCYFSHFCSAGQISVGATSSDGSVMAASFASATSDPLKPPSLDTTVPAVSPVPPATDDDVPSGPDVSPTP